MCSRRDYARILPARAVREHSPGIASPFTARGRMGDDNSVIIKMKRADHSLATQTVLVEWSGVQPELSGNIARSENVRATSYTEFPFYERNRRRDVYFWHGSFFFRFMSHSRNADSFFSASSRYISRGTPRMSRFTANCKCKFDSTFLSAALKITATRELLLLGDLCPYSPNLFTQFFTRQLPIEKRARAGIGFSANSLFNRFYRKDDIAQKIQF